MDRALQLPGGTSSGEIALRAARGSRLYRPSLRRSRRDAQMGGSRPIAVIASLSYDI